MALLPPRNAATACSSHPPYLHLRQEHCPHSNHSLVIGDLHFVNAFGFYCAIDSHLLDKRGGRLLQHTFITVDVFHGLAFKEKVTI